TGEPAACASHLPGERVGRATRRSTACAGLAGALSGGSWTCTTATQLKSSSGGAIGRTRRLGGPSSRSERSIGPLALKHHNDRPQQDLQVQPDAVVADVVHAQPHALVVLQLAAA